MNLGRTDVTGCPEAVVVELGSLGAYEDISEVSSFDSQKDRISEIFYLTRQELKHNLKVSYGSCIAGSGMTVGGLVLSASSVVSNHLEFTQFLFGFFGASLIVASSCFLGFGVGGIVHQKMKNVKLDIASETQIPSKALELGARLKKETSERALDERISKIFYLSSTQMESWTSEAQKWLSAGFGVAPFGWILHAIALTYHPERSKLLLGLAAASMLTISGLVLGFGLEGVVLKGRLTKVN